MLMSGESSDERKENALKTSLDYLDDILESQSYAACDHLTIADFSLLASVTQLEGMDYKLSGYKNLFKWMDKLKAELTYYDECNTAGIEMFRNWAKSRSSSSSTTTASSSSFPSSSSKTHKISSGAGGTTKPFYTSITSSRK